jgi:hypothetical protein
MGGQKQYHLERLIELLKKLGELPASEKYKKSNASYDREKATLFEELTGYSWHWSGEGWMKTLEEILAKYKAESERVKAAQRKKRGY